MKFAQDSQDEGYVITAYDKNSISINGKAFSKSLIIATRQLQKNWDIAAIESLQANHINQILSFNPELDIIGTGNRKIAATINIDFRMIIPILTHSLYLFNMNSTYLFSNQKRQTKQGEILRSSTHLL